MKELSIIIVNWNTKALLRNCLYSINQNIDDVTFEIIIVDNASFDGSPEMVKREFSHLDNLVLITNSQNLMYAQANNIGYKHACGKYICFLNTDTEVLKSTFKPLLSYLKNHPQTGIVGTMFLDQNGSIQRLYRRFPNLIYIFFYNTFIGKIIDNKLLKDYFLKKYTYADEKFEEPTKVEQVGTSCAIIPRKVIEKIGLFDERLRLFFNDVDLCKRIWQHGFEIWIIPSAKIIHLGSASTCRLPYRKQEKEFLLGMLNYFHKYAPCSLPLIVLLFPVKYFRIMLSRFLLVKDQIPFVLKFNQGDKIIDLGCGTHKIDGSIGVDLMRTSDVDVICNLERGLPFKNDSVDYIYTSHFLEHIDNLADLIHEIYRCLCPRGRLIIHVPHFSNPFGYSDPTHKRLFGFFSFDYYVPYDFQTGFRQVPNYQTPYFRIITKRIYFYSPLVFLRPFSLLLERIINKNSNLIALYEYHLSCLYPINSLHIEMESLKEIKPSIIGGKGIQQ